MRSKQLLLTLGFAAVLSAAATPASAQLLNKFLALEEVERATAIAKDSIGDNALLVGIATAGVIDLGGFGTYDGFDPSTGESSAWAYQFLTPSGDDGVAVGVAKFIIGDPLVITEDGNDFDLEPDELNLSGNFANSDAFVAQLKKNDEFKKYSQEYPEAVPEGIVLSWQPDAADELPETFPKDMPIWGIFYNTNADIPDDSTLVCFVASGTGVSHCVRFNVSGIDDPVAGNSGLGLSVAPNPARRVGTARLTIASDAGTDQPTEVCLYNAIGQQVLDLKDRLIPDGSGGFEAEFNLAGLDAGSYICRVVRGNSVQSIQIIVD